MLDVFGHFHYFRDGFRPQVDMKGNDLLDPYSAVI